MRERNHLSCTGINNYIVVSNAIYKHTPAIYKINNNNYHIYVNSEVTELIRNSCYLTIIDKNDTNKDSTDLILA